MPRASSCVLLALLAACASTPSVTRIGSAKVVRVITIWWKSTVGERDVEALRRALAAGAPQVPGLELTLFGTPAGTRRQIVDNSFGMLVVMRFRDREALANWEQHPVHRDLIARFGELAEKAVVHDAAE